MNNDVEIMPDDIVGLKNLAHNYAQEIESLQNKVESLEAQLRLFKKQAFQSKSERFSSNQQDMFSDELREELKLLQEPDKSDDNPVAIPAHTRKPRQKRQIDPSLPRVEVIHDLPEDQKTCSCGCELKFIGQEFSVEQLAIIPQKAYVIRHLKNKYVCKNCKEAPVRATMPRPPVPKSKASSILLAWLVTSKYVDGLPLYRLNKILKRCGVEFCHKSMARLLIQAGEHLDRLLEMWADHLNTYDIRQCDETCLQVLHEEDRLATNKSYLWIQRGGPPNKPVIHITYSASRSGEVAKSLLSGFRNGYLVVDAYYGYLAIAKDNELKIVNCMDHSRRKFKEAWDSLSTKQRKTAGGIARLALERFEKIYAIEASIKELSVEDRFKARQESSLKLLEDFYAWALKVKSSVIMTQKTKDGINYFINHYPELCRYCEDGRLPISNIMTEHCAKSIAIARKAFLFSNSPSGAQATAKFFSVVLTAQANGLDPFKYLTLLFTRLPNIKAGECLSQFDPWALSNDDLNEFMKEIPVP